VTAARIYGSELGRSAAARLASLIDVSGQSVQPPTPLAIQLDRHHAPRGLSVGRRATETLATPVAIIRAKRPAGRPDQCPSTKQCTEVGDRRISLALHHHKPGSPATLFTNIASTSVHCRRTTVLMQDVQQRSAPHTSVSDSVSGSACI